MFLEIQIFLSIFEQNNQIMNNIDELLSDNPFLNERDYSVKTIDDAFDMWDVVSMNVISDEWWAKNFEAVKEITFELYRLDIENKEENALNELLKSGKRLEIIFSILKRNNLLK